MLDQTLLVHSADNLSAYGFSPEKLDYKVGSSLLNFSFSAIIMSFPGCNIDGIIFSIHL